MKRWRIDAQAAALARVRAVRDNMPSFEPEAQQRKLQAYAEALAGAPAPEANTDQLRAERDALVEAIGRRDQGISDLRAALDAANARVAELEAMNRTQSEDLAAVSESWHAANARAEAAERALLVVSDARELAEDKRERAESESAALRAEVEEWRVALSAEQSRRATAEARLGQVESANQRNARLAAQPATAPIHNCDSPDCGTCAGAYFARTAPAQGWDVDDLVGKPAAAPVRP